MLTKGFNTNRAFNESSPQNDYMSDIYLLGKASKKKLVEFSTKGGGWGQQWTDFQLIFFFFLKKDMSLKHWMLP